MIWNLRKILQHSVTRDVMSQRGKSEFWFTSSFCCYLLKFRFHGQLDLLFESKAVSPVEWSPCCPRTIQPPLTASPCSRLSRPRSTISQSDFHPVSYTHLRAHETRHD